MRFDSLTKILFFLFESEAGISANDAGNRSVGNCKQQALVSKDGASGLQKLAGSRPWRQKMKHQACKGLQAAGSADKSSQTTGLVF